MFFLGIETIPETLIAKGVKRANIKMLELSIS